MCGIRRLSKASPVSTGFQCHPRTILIGATVSSDFFSVMRSNAMQGRTFTPDEEQAGRDQVVVISHGLWQRAFGANPNKIGQTLTLTTRIFPPNGNNPPG